MRLRREEHSYRDLWRRSNESRKHRCPESPMMAQIPPRPIRRLCATALSNRTSGLQSARAWGNRAVGGRSGTSGSTSSVRLGCVVQPSAQCDGVMPRAC